MQGRRRDEGTGFLGVEEAEGAGLGGGGGPAEEGADGDDEVEVGGGWGGLLGAQRPAAFSRVGGLGVAGVFSLFGAPGGGAVGAGVAGERVAAVAVVVVVCIVGVVEIAGVVRAGVVAVPDHRAAKEPGSGSAGSAIVTAGCRAGRRVGVGWRGGVLVGGELGPGLEQAKGVAALEELGHDVGAML